MRGSSAPVSLACTCCSAYAGWAFPCVSSRPGAVLAAPGIGTATQVRAATWRACSILTSSRGSSSRSGFGPSDMRRSRKSCVTSTMWQTGLTCAATFSSTHGCIRRPLTRSRTAGFLKSATASGCREPIASWLPAASRRPTCPNSRASTPFRARPTTPAIGRMRAWTSAASASASLGQAPRLSSRSRSLPSKQASGTPNYTIPAHNGPLDPAYQAAVKADYPGLRARAKQTVPGIDFNFNMGSALAADEEERQHEFEKRWTYGGLPFIGAFGDLLYNQAANDLAAEFVRGKIREIVRDPEVAELLSPRNVIGCKRLCVDTGYWETYNRPNVTLIDVGGEPIEGVTPAGSRAKGQEYAVDAIVFATGFDAMTGALLKIDIRGTGAQALKEKWREGPKTYLGLGIAGFPNLFTITGPGSPSVLTTMLPSIEQHVEWVADCIRYLREKGLSRIEAQAEAEENWVAHVREVAGASLRSTCSSWYIGANVPGKPRVFMPYIGGFPAYVEKCDAVADNAYEGFALA